MNDLSILILSNGNAVRQLSDEYPVPKSSSASEIPIPFESFHQGMIFDRPFQQDGSR